MIPESGGICNRRGQILQELYQTRKQAEKRGRRLSPFPLLPCAETPMIGAFDSLRAKQIMFSDSARIPA